MTKERREELRAKVNYWESGAGGENWGPMEPDELRALLDSDERLEALEARERYVDKVIDGLNDWNPETAETSPAEACAQTCSQEPNQ